MLKTLPEFAGKCTFIVEDVENSVFNRLVRIMHQSTRITMEEIRRGLDIDDFEDPNIQVIYYNNEQDRFLVNAKVATIEDVLNELKKDERYNDSLVDIEYDNCYLTKNSKWTLFSKDMRYYRIVEMYLKRKGIIK